MRRDKLTSCLTLLLVFSLLLALLAGCQPQETPGPGPADPGQEPGEEPGEEPEELKETVKVGILVPLTGGFGANGAAMRDAFILLYEQRGGVFAGHPIEFFVEDTEGNPSVALTKARKLVEQNEVDFVIGPLLANCAYAVADYVIENDLTMINWAGAENIAKRNSDYHVLTPTWTSSQPVHPFAEYVYNEMGIRKVTLIGMDYDFGHEVIGAFHYVFEELGGEVLDKIWTPIGAADYAPYLSSISDETEAIFSCHLGADSIRLINTYEEYGFKETIGDLLMIGPGVDEVSLPSIGDAALGMITPLHYSAAIDTPINREFIEQYERRFGKPGGYFAEGFYTCGLALEAILDLEDDFRDPLKVSEAFKTAEIKSPKGTFVIDDYFGPIQDVYVRRVEKVGDRYQNTIIHTFKEVSQFWKWDPDEYIARPTYSRDYPPLD